MSKESLSASNFDRQFSISKTRALGRKVRSVDIAPEVETAKSQLPVIFVPGVLETPMVNKGPLRVLSDQGRHVISFTHLRRGGEVSDIAVRGIRRDRWEALSADFPETTLRRALTVLDLINSKQIDQTDAVAHSLGCIDVVAAAYLNPEKFRNLVLVDPAGFMPDDSPKKLARRARKQMDADKNGGKGPLPHTTAAQLYADGDDQIPNADYLKAQYPTREAYQAADDKLATATQQMAADRLSPAKDLGNLATHILPNPKRVYDEGKATISPIEKLLLTIRDDGIGVAVIHAVNDQNFPIADMLGSKMLYADKFVPDGTLIRRGTIDGFISIQGSHNNYIGDPRIMQWADHFLTKLLTRASQPLQ